MQSINLRINAGAAQTVPFDGNLFVYESGVGVPGNGDYRIVVKPDSGNEIVLRPGQRFRTTRTQAWHVRPNDPAVGIDGVIVIGSGEFDDAAIDQVVRLDGAYNNNVSVNNTAANRVPVSLDPSLTQKVTGAIVAYTDNFQSMSVSAGSPSKVFDASVNTKGVIINRLNLSLVPVAGVGMLSLLAKPGSVAPVSPMDGEVIALKKTEAGGGTMCQDLASEGMLQVPAGRSLWIVAYGANTSGLNSVFYAVL